MILDRTAQRTSIKFYTTTKMLSENLLLNQLPHSASLMQRSGVIVTSITIYLVERNGRHSVILRNDIYLNIHQFWKAQICMWLTYSPPEWMRLDHDR